MPVTPKYTWRETDDEVVVDVALRGALVRKPDITLATAFLKLSSPPYLLAIDLYGEVDSERARAELNADGLQLHLPKVQNTPHLTFCCSPYLQIRIIQQL